MPNGWKKNAAYVGENANSHQEYLEEKNKFRKWKKNNKVNCYYDIYDIFLVQPRLCERGIAPIPYRLFEGMKWNSKNTENTCYTKFVYGKSRVYSNERNSRYAEIGSDPYNKRYKKTNHQEKKHNVKKNYNKVNVLVPFL